MKSTWMCYWSNVWKRASMLTISYSIHQIQPRRPSSRHYSNNTSKLTWWEMSNNFRGFVYLAPAQRRQHFRSSMPVRIHIIHSPLVLSSKCKQGSQYDAISLRLPNWFHFSSWSPWSWSYSLTTSLSENFWLHKLVCNLHSSWNCTCSHILCLLQ